ncbi:EscU/YscU/HrcU family type III secretion system export apparatus switch protein [Leeia oryzae]|uniref:EscU/YscU/HrcU family type III secretion system export apparatus switch protein n=1 Tax=Leeia oryzae TaxID=356662 RepID=UPI000365A29C|nr:EscU/YscU/HrcU family type III secretion system export apparatus switch protein [Leeia oryzae]
MIEKKTDQGDPGTVQGQENKRPGVNPLAVAISYAAGESAAPQVVAKGKGLIAEAIIAQAKAAGVYVHESKDLVALLMQVDLDQQIPPELYRAVAEVLAFIYMLEHGASTEVLAQMLPTGLPVTP